MANGDKDVKSFIEQAFKSAPNNLTATLTDKDKKEIEVFALKSPAYYELQVYVHLGVATSHGSDAWNLIVPEAARSELNDIDATTFADTVNAFTSVHDNCSGFDVHTMGKFVTITSAIMQFCSDSIKYIEGKGLLSDQFKLLLAETSDSTTKEHAKKVITALCVMMAKKADLRAAECETLVNEIVGFASSTQDDRDRVRRLEHKYIGKESDDDHKFYVVDDNSNFVMKDGQKVVNYLTQIRKKSSEFANRAIQERKKAAEDWDKWRDLTIVSTTAVTYMAIPVIGWIAGPAVAIGCGTAAALARDDMHEQEKMAADDEKKAAALTTLTNAVTAVIGQLTMTERAMNDAINALDQLKNSFTAQGTQLRAIAGGLNDLEDEANDPDKQIPELVDLSLDEAKTAWAKVKYLAQDFILNFGVDYKGVQA